MPPIIGNGNGLGWGAGLVAPAKLPLAFDVGSLVGSDLTQPEWVNNVASSEAPTITATTDSGVACAYVNPGANAPSLGAIQTWFTATCSSVRLRVRAKLPPGVLASKIRLTITDNPTTTAFADSSPSLTSSWVDYTVDATGLTPGNTYLVYLEFNRGLPYTTVQAQALISSVRVEPLDGAGMWGAPFVRLRLNHADLQDDAYPTRWGTSSVQQCVALSSTLAWLECETDATDGALEFLGDSVDAAAFSANKVVIDVNGAAQQAVTCSGIGADYLTTMPAGTKRLGVHVGYQALTGGGLQGIWPRALYLATSTLTQVTNHYASTRSLVIGDSISIGFNATPGLSAWERIRYAKATRPSLAARGRATLYEIGTDGATRQAWVDALPSVSYDRIWLALGTNDFAGSTGLSPWLSSLYGVALADLLDKLHAKYPRALIRVQSPLYRTDEATPNSNGEVLDDFRTAASTACTGRSWATYVDGSHLISAGDLAGDGVHLTTAGHGTYATAITAAL